MRVGKSKGFFDEAIRVLFNYKHADCFTLRQTSSMFDFAMTVTRGEMKGACGSGNEALSVASVSMTALCEQSGSGLPFPGIYEGIVPRIEVYPPFKRGRNEGSFKFSVYENQLAFPPR